MGFALVAMMDSSAVGQELRGATVKTRKEGCGERIGRFRRWRLSDDLLGRRENHIEEAAANFVFFDAKSGRHLCDLVLEIEARIGIKTWQADLPALELRFVRAGFRLHVRNAMLRPIPNVDARPIADSIWIAAKPSVVGDGKVKPDGEVPI
jgi:hypothetical protein